MENKLKKSGVSYLLRVLLQVIIGLMVFLISAGILYSFRGLIYFSLYIISTTIGVILLVKNNPEVLNERAKKRDNTKKWDKILLKLYIFIAFFGIYIVAGLDIGRYHLSNLPIYFMGPSMVIYILSSALGIWAMAVNKNFEATSRIQKNRNQLVCSTGPYKFIRHPGYLAVVLWSASIPFIFGSIYTIIPSSGVLIIIMIRTYLEDTMLKKGLQGYIQYSNEVKYRLIPFVF